MTDINIRLNVDESGLKQAAARASQVARAFSKTLRLASYMTEAVGIVIDQTLRIAIQAGTQIVEYATAAIAAGSFTPFGALQTVGRIASITFLIFQINALRRGRSEIAHQFGAMEEGLSIIIG